MEGAEEFLDYDAFGDILGVGVVDGDGAEFGDNAAEDALDKCAEGIIHNVDNRLQLVKDFLVDALIFAIAEPVLELLHVVESKSFADLPGLFQGEVVLIDYHHFLADFLEDLVVALDEGLRLVFEVGAHILVFTVEGVVGEVSLF